MYHGGCFLGDSNLVLYVVCGHRSPSIRWLLLPPLDDKNKVFKTTVKPILSPINSFLSNTPITLHIPACQPAAIARDQTHLIQELLPIGCSQLQIDSNPRRIYISLSAMSSSFATSSSANGIMPNMLRTLGHRPKPEIKITLSDRQTSELHTYSTFDRIEGMVTVTAVHDTPIESIDIQFNGMYSPYLSSREH